MAPSAATTPAAAKTAASTQEFNDEWQEPGWIFCVMGGSVAAVTIGTDDLNELVLDSGSVWTACPLEWCSNISVNNEGSVLAKHSMQCSIACTESGTS